jgi:hypothetical protein
MSPVPTSVREAVGFVPGQALRCLKETHPLPAEAGRNVGSDQVQRCVFDNGGGGGIRILIRPQTEWLRNVSERPPAY